jgi:hypothetical protein
MKYLLLIFLPLLFINREYSETNWIITSNNLYNLRYKIADREDVKEYESFINTGIADIQHFFNSSYVRKFEIIVHPDRLSIDSAWQQGWDLPAFKSECWMVASGTAFRLDLLSPKVWQTEACEHNYADLMKTQQLITHELVHVFHGQFNPSHDFSEIEELDWFIEGLATYASGQCDSARISMVKSVIANKNGPSNLESFWIGNLKYGLSGSLVMFIDKKYGREKLVKLISLTKKTEFLTELKTRERTLLTEWEEYIRKL